MTDVDEQFATLEMNPGDGAADRCTTVANATVRANPPPIATPVATPT